MAVVTEASSTMGHQRSSRCLRSFRSSQRIKHAHSIFAHMLVWGATMLTI